MLFPSGSARGLTAAEAVRRGWFGYGLGRRSGRVRRAGRLAAKKAASPTQRGVGWARFRGTGGGGWLPCWVAVPRLRLIRVCQVKHRRGEITASLSACRQISMVHASRKDADTAIATDGAMQRCDTTVVIATALPHRGPKAIRWFGVGLPLLFWFPLHVRSRAGLGGAGGAAGGAFSPREIFLWEAISRFGSPVCDGIVANAAGMLAWIGGSIQASLSRERMFFDDPGRW